jgi:photosystem II stability/assembly factor-like uncharacterized protein
MGEGAGMRNASVTGFLLLSSTMMLPAAAVGKPARASAAAPAAVPQSGLRYRLVGPFRGGRATGVAGVPSDVNTYYFGAAAGGVWKTTDSGRTWKPLWDNLPGASPSIGAIVVSPSNPNVVYAGTGEGAIRGNVVAGNGVYKSVDAGKTWSFSGLKDSQFIGRMAISATDPDTVFVAALGHLYGPNDERGIFRTRDGGKTWQRVLFVDDKTGAIDVQIDPTDPKTIYAGMWQVSRKPWLMESGGPGSGLYRSRDGGTTWERLSGHGLPEGVLGRIGVAPTSDPKRVYALIEAEKGGLYRTDDAGANWMLVNGDNAYKQRAWYYTNVFADPKDSNKVFVMNTGAFKSLDGGATFKPMPTFHGDNHQIWINPINTNYMVNSNDGGGGVSTNGGETWTEEMNQPTAQFYHIATDNVTPYNLYGAQQDNTTVKIASGNVRGPIGVESWYSVGGGESGYVVPDPKDPEIVVANGYGGNVTRYDNKTHQMATISPWAREVMGWAPKDLKHRSQWTEPLAFSPHDPSVLYNANEVLFRSTDAGKTWATISPDLTRNDKSKQLSSGGPLTKDNTGIETYDTIFSVNESPVRKGLIWTGTDDGLVQLSRDAGGNWENVTPKGMPEWGTVDMVEPHPAKPGTAYIAVDSHRLDDLTPHAFRTDDYGKSWTSITDGLPADAYVHVVRADPARDGLLYAGTENGVFVSFDDGARWKPLQLNLPRTPVHDLAVHGNDLAVATHGRAFWVLDDLSPLQQWSDAIPGEPVHLFKPRPAVRILYSGRGDMTGTSVGTNPPTGAVLYYYLRDAPVAKGADKDSDRNARAGRVKLEILDAAGAVIRTYPAAFEPGQEDAREKEPDEESRSNGPPRLTAERGLNRFVWDLRYEGPVKVPRAALWHASVGGPVALPGHYAVRLTVDGRSTTQPLELRPNPSGGVTQDQLKKQFDLVTAINADLNEVQDAVLEIRSLHRQLADARTSAGKGAQGAAIVSAADALEARVDAVEDKLIQKKSIAHEDPLNYPIRLNNMLASLATTVSVGDTEPNQPQYAEFRELDAIAKADVAEWSQIKATDIPAFNATLAQRRVKPMKIAAMIERDLEQREYRATEATMFEDEDD